MNKKTLEWGETPWDHMGHWEMLRTIQKMYSALVSVYSALNMLSVNNASGYFGNNGTGGKALEKGRQVIEPLNALYENGSEDIYRSFFRYADDLLFERSVYRIGSGWAVCPECGAMLGTTSNNLSAIGKACADNFPFRKNVCKGTFRALQWEDLEPRSKLKTPQLTFENVLWNGEDQVIVKKILRELVPPDIQKEVIERFIQEVNINLESEE